jgi:predicted membrane metal-binding protein
MEKGVKRVRQTHEDLSRVLEVTGSGDRSFGFVFAAVFLIVALWPLAGGGELRTWSLGVAVLFLTVAAIRPGILSPLNQVWFRFGSLLGTIVSPVALGVVFFLVMTPIGLVMRLLGRPLLPLRRADTTDSYWIPRAPPGPAPESMQRQF